LGLLIAAYFLLAPLEDVLATSGNTVAKYFALAICLLALQPILRDARHRLRMDAVVGSLVYLAALAWVSVAWAQYPDSARTAASSYVLLIGLFVVVYFLDLSAGDISLIERLTVLGGWLSAAYIVYSGQLQDILSQRLVLTDTSDPNNLSALLALPAILSFHKFLRSESTKIRVVYFISFLGLSFLMVATGSRGAMLGLGAFLLVYAFLLSRSTGIRKLLTVVGGLLVVITVIISVIPAELRDRLFSLGGYTVDFTGQSTNTRSVIWSHVVEEVIPNMPLYGVGSGNAPDMLVPWYFDRRGVHSIYLNMIVEYGILGIPVFFGFLGALFIRNLRRSDYLRVSALIAFLVIAAFLDAFTKKYFWNAMIYIAIGLRAPDATTAHHPVTAVAERPKTVSGPARQLGSLAPATRGNNH